MSRREQEKIQRKLELTQREIELLRMHDVRISSRQLESPFIEEAHGLLPQNGVEAISQMLNEFYGSEKTVKRWEKQLGLLRDIYWVDDGILRLVIRSRFQGKAVEWFHFKPDHVGMGPEILQDVIQGIPDFTLRDHAQIQRFRRKADLLTAFENMTLRRTQTVVPDVLMHRLEERVPKVTKSSDGREPMLQLWDERACKH